MPLDPTVRDLGALEDMLLFCHGARAFLAGHDRESFRGDEKTQSAVTHQLLLLGEAAKRLSAPTRSMDEGVPWRRITGLRDHLIHSYHDVDLDEVYDTVVRDLPDLFVQIEALRERLGRAR